MIKDIEITRIPWIIQVGETSSQVERGGRRVRVRGGVMMESEVRVTQCWL